MAQFRSLSRAEIEDIIRDFGVSPADYRGHRPIAAGTINTNVAIDTALGRRFLRINEGKSEEDVAREAAIVEHLAGRGLPTPRPGRSRDGLPYLRWQGQFVSLFPWVDGRVLARAELTEGQVAQVGRALAQLHQLGTSFPDRRPGRYEPAEIDARLAGIRSAVTARGGADGDPAVIEAVARLAPELRQLAVERAVEVPLGLIHGDLFVDNVLFSPTAGGETLLALLDFEQASWGRLVYDVAVTLLAFTFGRDDFRTELVTAFLSGYQGLRRLEEVETQVLGAELRFAACRFAVTRITDVHLKRTLGAPGGKDFQRYLLRLARVQERLRREPAAFLA